MDRKCFECGTEIPEKDRIENNLPPSVKESIVSKYGHEKLGRQRCKKCAMEKLLKAIEK